MDGAGRRILRNGVVVVKKSPAPEKGRPLLDYTFPRDRENALHEGTEGALSPLGQSTTWTTPHKTGRRFWQNSVPLFHEVGKFELCDPGFEEAAGSGSAGRLIVVMTIPHRPDNRFGSIWISNHDRIPAPPPNLTF